MDEQAGADRAFGFHGNWREFAPIAFTNLALTIVTLGIYHFWAKTRVRRYLWSRTRFIDERLEWTGTGKELFIGYLIALVAFVLPFGAINLIVQGAVLRGHPGLAGLIFALAYLGILYLFGVAMFRAVRYRLSRTFWHGIRGGSDDQGFAYGWQYLWRTIVGALAAGLMVPWSMARLWNERWGAMSFGPLRFSADAGWRPVFGRYMLFYAVPIVLFVIVVIGGMLFAGAGIAMGFGRPPSRGGMVTIILLAILFYAVFFGVLGLVALAFYAAYFREAVGHLRLGELDFGFDATTKEWILLYLGNLGLVVVTLGIGYIFVPYRTWSFVVRHMACFGEIKLDELTRSTTRAPGQGEGLLDAFDVGAF